MPGDAVRSLLLRSVDIRANRPGFSLITPTRFAQRTARTGKKYAGVVLLHGGAGWAFRQWVEKWAAEGYAAIAIDLCGNGPEIRPLPDGGPNRRRRRSRIHAGRKRRQKRSWTYHAVSSAILAHSLLLSMKQVDADKDVPDGHQLGRLPDLHRRRAR